MRKRIQDEDITGTNRETHGFSSPGKCTFCLNQKDWMMLIDDADTTLMVLYDTVLYTRRLLTVRHNTEHIQRDTCIQITWSLSFGPDPRLHPTSYLLFVCKLFIRLQLYSIPWDSTTQLHRFQSFSLISISLISYPQIPDSANIFPRISRIRTLTQSVAQFSMQPSLRFRATMTSVLPSLAMKLTFLCSSMAGYHNDASDDDAVAAGKPATEQAVSCYLSPINAASFKPNRINRTLSRVRH